MSDNLGENMAAVIGTGMTAIVGLKVLDVATKMASGTSKRKPAPRRAPKRPCPCKACKSRRR